MTTPSESMIKRVARAIETGDGHDPDEHVYTPDGEFHARWRLAVPAACAVLQAMRLPTEAMLASAWREITADKKAAGIARLGPGPGVSDWWQAMIDAALSEGKQP